MLSDSSDNGDTEVRQKRKRQQSEDVIDVDGRDDSDDIQVLDGSAILGESLLAYPSYNHPTLIR